MFAKYPLLSRVVLLIVLPCAIGAGMLYRHLQRSLPQVDGEIATAAIGDRIEIARDRHGVPSITARSDRDAFFAIGYVHAQDRMWQLELQRRIAHGRLSEVFGKESVQQDVWFRSLGLSVAARSSWNALSPDAQASLQAYADGINAWLATNPVLPVEFGLLGVKPEPWTPYDSLAWVKVFALDLGGNYRREIERLLAGQMLEPHKLRALIPQYPADGATTIALDRDAVDKLGQLDALHRSVESELHIGGRFVGSNAWVVSGRFAVDGAALLANDPHLGLQMPSLWYMLGARGDALDVHGATLVGLPVVVFGRNREIAWGGTNLMADAQDLYLEQVKPDDPGYYRDGERWRPFDVRVETIRVKQDFPALLRSPYRPLQIKVRTSRHGPIVSDVVQLFDQPAALRWTALDADDASYEAFLKLNYARDWDGFQSAAQHLVAPALNLMYADRGGNIGYVAAGRMPIRASGEGVVPVPGWDDSHAWIGAIPFEQWPRSYNPPAGYLVSANNKVVDDAYPHLITHDWAPPARANRITHLLDQAIAGGTPLDLAAMGKMQGDTISEPARALLPYMLDGHAPNDQWQARAHEILRAWDGDMRRDSPGATIFNAWARRLKQEVLSDDLAGWWNHRRESGYVRPLADDVDLDALRGILANDVHGWCDVQLTTDYVETCDDVLNDSLDRAIQELLKLENDDSMDSWAWGDMHETLYRHTPFSQTNMLRALFQRRIGNGGSLDTINVANYAPQKSGVFAQDFGAGFRQLIALRPDAVEHLYMNSTGQSGNVMSAHYDDMVEPFRDVRFHSIAGDAPASTLVLRPAAAAGGAR